MELLITNFTLVPYQNLVPTFNDDSPWHNIKCLDIFTYDECSVADYISNQENIVIKSGEQYYGFTRESFLSSTIPYGRVLKTPLGHIISRVDLTGIKLKSGFIFEVLPLNNQPPYTNTLKVLLGKIKR